jgi:hypothetical protein
MEKAIGNADYAHRFVGSKRPSLHQTLIVELACGGTTLSEEWLPKTGGIR